MREPDSDQIEFYRIAKNITSIGEAEKKQKVGEEELVGRRKINKWCGQAHVRI
jgi:hypothetical protein